MLFNPYLSRLSATSDTAYYHPRLPYSAPVTSKSGSMKVGVWHVDPVEDSGSSSRVGSVTRKRLSRSVPSPGCVYSRGLLSYSAARSLA
jgi:hypothetical protein